MQKALANKLAVMFPDPEKRAQVERELQRYGVESYEREHERVRLAVLKLAGANVDEVRRFVDAACGDYRDVLAWAEYPEAMSLPPGKADAEVHRRDRAQYEAWLSCDGADRSDRG